MPPHAPEMPAPLSHSLHRWASHGITQCHVHGIAEHHMHGASHGAWHGALHAGQGRLMQASQRPMQSTVGHRVASQSTLWHCRASCGIVDHRVGHHRASHRVPQVRALHRTGHIQIHTYQHANMHRDPLPSLHNDNALHTHTGRLSTPSMREKLL